MQAQELMTRDPACCTPEDPAQKAAELMSQHDCGAIPVVDNEDSRQLCGMITDRDIAIRGVARGRGAEAKVEELMTRDPECCGADSDIEEVERIMSERQVRRVPIIDAGGQLVGIISQADLARSDNAISDKEVGQVVERISEPGRRVRSAAGD
jgi:CBS domain-containing protein